MKFKIAALQLNAGPDIAENLDAAAALIEKAAQGGAKVIATPENTCHMRSPSELRLQSATTAQNHPVMQWAAEQAIKHQVYLLVGSCAVKSDNGKVFNRSLFYTPEGRLAAQYDKIHLFDVQLPNGDVYAESKTTEAGHEAVVVKTPLAVFGLSVCYDVRFAYLYRQMAQAGAEILFVPAAFTVPTGQAHWEVLLRARAIECGAYVVAPAQVGMHEGGRATYGHSLIISPWGEVLADAGGTGTGIIEVEIDLEKVKQARGNVPALKHDSQFRLRAV